LRSAEDWFHEYSETHRNTANQKIHFVCVPLIYWSVAALLWELPLISSFGYQVNWTFLILIPVLLFYFSLGKRYFFSMFFFSAISVLSIFMIEKSGAPLLVTAVSVFVLAWAGQFYGHLLEGKKPSFFTDLAFLLIGPAWICEKLINKFF
jgi:uncharacterized membrane protein YGL010W